MPTFDEQTSREHRVNKVGRIESEIGRGGFDNMAVSLQTYVRIRNLPAELLCGTRAIKRSGRWYIRRNYANFCRVRSCSSGI